MHFIIFISFLFPRLIRDFERDARADNMPLEEMNYRKKQLVQELNSFIGLKKAYGAQLSTRGELVGSGVPQGPTQEDLESEFFEKVVFAFSPCSFSFEKFTAKYFGNNATDKYISLIEQNFK